MTKILTGKVALVTGGSRGIGAATVRALAENGADVALGYAASDEKAKAIVDELEEKGIHALAIKADQADPVQVEVLIKAVDDRFGRLDILVNNAGVFVAGMLGDHDVPFTFALPVSMPQLLAWMRLLAKVQRGELQP